MAVAYCKTIEKEGVLTTPKHFIANYGDGGRDSYPVALTERELREVYLPPFKAAIQEAGASSVMASYNSLDGLPCSANPWLLTQLLRKEWGFRGFVVSDYGSVGGIKDKHAVAATDKETARKAVEAGLDVELPDIFYFGRPLLEAATESPTTAAAVDEAARRVLRAKFALGLFEDPYVKPEAAACIDQLPGPSRPGTRSGIQSHRAAEERGRTPPAQEGAAYHRRDRSDGGLVALGGYSGSGMDSVTILQGIRRAAGPDVRVTYEKGSDVGITAIPPFPKSTSFRRMRSRGSTASAVSISPTRIFTAPGLVRVDRQVHFTGERDRLPGLPEDWFSVRWTGKLVPTVTGTTCSAPPPTTGAAMARRQAADRQLDGPRYHA